MVLSPPLDDVLLRVGDIDLETGEPPVPPDAGPVEQALPGFWAKWAWIAVIDPYLQTLYTERDARQLFLSIVQDEVNTSVGQGALSLALSDRAKVQQERLAAVQVEIVRIETRAAANRPGQVGDLATRNLPPPPWMRGWPGVEVANSPRLGGSAYLPDRLGPRRDW